MFNGSLTLCLSSSKKRKKKSGSQFSHDKKDLRVPYQALTWLLNQPPIDFFFSLSMSHTRKMSNINISMLVHGLCVLVYSNFNNNFPFEWQVLGDITAPKTRSAWGRSSYWLIFQYIDGFIINGKGTLDGQGSSWWPSLYYKQELLNDTNSYVG